ncbi:LuxR C-terminal-related transcriptional regulator [Halocella sp. SP3-1]|uniref:response regulator transcription factor n=1 Tax=Halocella sp. SP3-1 TaxID=2382161 RepID=UPI000F75F1BB|nr:LuxR C-terminal-related transcriptional regulator [Halocella sp. SP3-1]AZO93284.1 LuxR family transcriptional regulator [Halocella sp. SP3-1]
MMISNLNNSWVRCFKMGLPKQLEHPQYYADSLILEEESKKHLSLIQNFTKYVNKIADKYYLENSLFILANQQGINLKTVYPIGLKEKVSKMRIKEGCYFTEKSCGTNAISMAMEYKETVVFNGDENYCYFLQKWQSIATPISYPKDKQCFLGILTLGKNHREKFRILLELLQTKLSKKLNENTIPSHYNQGKSLTNIRESVLTLSANGLTIKEISQKLNLSEAAIKYHRTKACQQLCAANITQAIAKSIKFGYISLNTIK